MTIDGTSPVNRVTVDIKPGGFPNSYGCKSVGNSLAVGVLSAGDFDATKINADSVRFGKTGTEAQEVHRTKTGAAVRHLADLNGDGKLDMVFHFTLGVTGFSCSDLPSGQKNIDLVGILKGHTMDGTAFGGSDTLRLTPGK